MTAPYAARRARVLEAIGANGAMVLPAAPELRIGPDTDVRYVPDAELFWLSGYTEPQAVGVLCPGGGEDRFVLFVRPRDPDRELWTGRRGGLEAALEEHGAAAAYPIDELETRLPGLVREATTLYVRLGQGRPELDRLMFSILAAGRRHRPRRGVGIDTLRDPGVVLDPMRRRKDAFEIDRLRAAAELTAAAFRDAARRIRPGTGEWEVEAALDAGFRSRGAWGSAFPTIVAGGTSATTLHYTANDRVLQSGELVLLDAGARHAMYCGDISRTFPVSGTFSPEQRRLYEVVLDAHGRAITAARPGATIGAVHDAALRALIEGLRDLGCLVGETESLLANPDAWRHWYPHRTSHWLGLDVHDVGAYMEAGRDVVLEPGMVFTVEPGLYLAADAERCPPPLRGTGIRIEDDVLITDGGHEVLTGSLPAGADEVTDLMS